MPEQGIYAPQGEICVRAAGVFEDSHGSGMCRIGGSGPRAQNLGARGEQDLLTINTSALVPEVDSPSGAREEGHVVTMALSTHSFLLWTLQSRLAKIGRNGCLVPSSCDDKPHCLRTNLVMCVLIFVYSRIWGSC